MSSKLLEARRRAEEEARRASTPDGDDPFHVGKIIDPAAFDIAKAPLPGAVIKRILLSEIDPAPPEWNFFEDQSEEKVLELAMSLKSEGQIAPIVVRQITGGRWQALAGHTRIKAAKMLYAQDPTYDGLFAFAYPRGTCSDVQARRIVVYSNTAQRTHLSPQERQQIFCFEFLDSVNNDRNQKASTLLQQLMEKHGIKKSHAYRLRNIGQKLIPEMQQLFQSGQISFRSAETVSSMGTMMQEHLVMHHLSKISNESIKIVSKMTTDQADEFFASMDQPVKTSICPAPQIHSETANSATYTVTIPKDLTASFHRHLRSFYKKYAIEIEQSS